MEPIKKRRYRNHQHEEHQDLFISFCFFPVYPQKRQKDPDQNIVETLEDLIDPAAQVGIMHNESTDHAKKHQTGDPKTRARFNLSSVLGHFYQASWHNGYPSSRAEGIFRGMVIGVA
jgi:hypothetical protein